MATNYIAPTWRMPENTNKNKFSNYSINFDGAATTNINVGNMTAMQGASTFSIAAWINVDSTGQQRIFGSWEAAATKRIVGFGIHTNNKLLLQISSNGSSFDQLFSTSTIASANTWYHVAVTFSSGTAEFYIDGASAGTDTSSITSIYNISNDYFIGSFISSSSIPFDGKMGQVCVFDYTLSTDQVTYLYNLNNPMAITGKKPVAYYQLGDNSNPIRITGYPNLAVGGSVFNFNGSNQAIHCGSGSRFDIDQVAISSWVKFDSVSPNLQIISGIRNTSNGLMPYTLSARDYSGVKFRFLINQSSDSAYKIIYSNDNIVVNTWYHVVGIADGSNIKMYVNGDLQTDQTTYDGTILSPTQNFNIGRQPSNPLYYLDGQISNVAVFNTGLSESQVETLYNNGAPGDISSLSPLGWWKLNGVEDVFSANWTIKDYGSGSNDGTSVLMTSSNLVQSNLDSTTPYSNYSLKFNGSTQYFGDGTTSGVFNGATSFSISQWMTIDPGETFSIGAASWQGVGQYQYLFRYRAASGGFDFYARVGGASPFGRFTTAITSGAWYHVVGTWDGSTVRIYVNGVEGTPMATTGTLDASTGENFIGRYQGYRADGLMSNVAYWYNKALTQQEVVEIYNAGVTTDLNNFSGGAPTRWYPIDGKSTYFNGSNLIARDVINNVNMLGVNISKTLDGNAPGSTGNGTGSNLDITDLKGDMSGSVRNSYSINMADYGDPNSQGVTPANSGRTTSVPG